jgi:hypothetical protein
MYATTLSADNLDPLPPAEQSGHFGPWQVGDIYGRGLRHPDVGYIPRVLDRRLNGTASGTGSFCNARRSGAMGGPGRSLADIAFANTVPRQVDCHWSTDSTISNTTVNVSRGIASHTVAYHYGPCDDCGGELLLGETVQIFVKLDECLRCTALCGTKVWYRSYALLRQRSWRDV